MCVCAFYQLALNVLIKSLILIFFTYLKSKEFQKGIEGVLKDIPKKYMPWP